MRSAPEIQRAILFLSGLAGSPGAPLPARPDYEALARRASELGQDLSPGAVEQAFRLMMRARLVALRQPPGGDR